MKHVRNDERGATMVMFAIVSTGLLAMIGIAIDGGAVYAERRQQQNAADFSAMAATRALDEHDLGEPATVIRDAATATATSNGSDTTSVICELVDESRALLGPCPTSGTAVAAGAAGVRVSLSKTNATKFIRVVGSESVKAAADATAQIQSLRNGSSPFLFCAGGGASNEFPTVPVLLDPNGDGVYSDYAINPAAMGGQYTLHGPQVKTCAAGSNSFKGLADDMENFPIPGWWETKTGVEAGPTRVELAGPGGCNGKPFVGCKLVVPLCTQVRGQSSSLEMYCWTLGVFKITSASAPEHDAVFLGPGVVTSGLGGGKPLDGEARLIKLTE